VWLPGIFWKPYTYCLLISRRDILDFYSPNQGPVRLSLSSLCPTAVTSFLSPSSSSHLPLPVSLSPLNSICISIRAVWDSCWSSIPFSSVHYHLSFSRDAMSCGLLTPTVRGPLHKLPKWRPAYWQTRREAHKREITERQMEWYRRLSLFKYPVTTLALYNPPSVRHIFAILSFEE